MKPRAITGLDAVILTLGAIGGYTQYSEGSCNKGESMKPRAFDKRFDGAVANKGKEIRKKPKPLHGKRAKLSK